MFQVQSQHPRGLISMCIYNFIDIFEEVPLYSYSFYLLGVFFETWEYIGQFWKLGSEKHSSGHALWCLLSKNWGTTLCYYLQITNQPVTFNSCMIHVQVHVHIQSLLRKRYFKALLHRENYEFSKFLSLKKSHSLWERRGSLQVNKRSFSEWKPPFTQGNYLASLHFSLLICKMGIWVRFS